MVSPSAIDFIDPEDSPNSPDVTDELIHEVDAILGVMLPDTYINLMRQHNGGYIPEHLVRIEAAIPPLLAYYIDNGFVSVGSIYGINTDPQGELSIARTTYLIEEWDLPKGLVLLDGDGHTWIALDYRQAETNPPVIFLISDGGHHFNIASDFEDFIARLVPYGDVYDEDGNLKAVL